MMSEFEDKLDAVTLQRTQQFIAAGIDAKGIVIREINKLPTHEAVAVSARVTLGLPPYLQPDFVRLTMWVAENPE